MHAMNRWTYGGSFTVAGTDQSTRSEYVRSTIHKLQVPTAGTKPVLLIVSLEGIKVCGPEGKEIYMSHALRRISYATCDPSRGQFSFLAREPRGHLNLQYCHTFFTGSADKGCEGGTACPDLILRA
ncbi:SH2 domain-containing protein 5 [Amphibalanus amphitrite]|uniref:SH2 domain-containing protein 5 n=1 Tax=Amphibalanus amphitrite TaxID=1232801 RepID=A0A6A4WLT1_AMPAM|nr:SH2 domain-containing protein 5 [Amphibalanus amphitrite]